MKIRFYIDPICPWCWITSRWMTEVSAHRDLEIEFCSFSLAIKNDILGSDSQEGYAPAANKTHGILRIIEKIKQESGDKANELVAKFYAEAGKKIHVEGNNEFNWVRDALDEIGVDSSFANARNDESFDVAIKASMDLSMKSVGNDVGVPILILETENGDRGFFGPVISELPTTEESLILFDSISAMISIPGFYELKRTREIDSDTASTARLFDGVQVSTSTDESQACPL
jgi:hypothetical protein